MTRRGWSWWVVLLALFLAALSLGHPPAGSSALAAQVVASLLFWALLVGLLARAAWRRARKSRPGL